MNNDTYDSDAIEAISRINNELVNAQRELAKANVSLDTANITLRSNIKEKETLFKELQHRVKNNMQVISSLIGMQSQTVADEATQRVLKNTQERIKSMMLIYEHLYRSTDLVNIEMRHYITDLVNKLMDSYSVGPMTFRTPIDVCELYVTADIAIPCGLIVNEVISNSLKYAFPGEKEGQIHIIIRQIDGLIEMTLGDNGVGMPDNASFDGTKSLGMLLIQTLAEDQLGGKMELSRANGTEYRITFPFKSNDTKS